MGKFWVALLAAGLVGAREILDEISATHLVDVFHSDGFRFSRRGPALFRKASLQPSLQLHVVANAGGNLTLHLRRDRRPHAERRATMF